MTTWDHDPTPARDVRVGDRERTEAADRLSAHMAAGRLSVEELEQRLEQVQAAVFTRDLGAVEADLPAPRRRATAPRRAPLMAISIACLLAAALASVVVGHPLAPGLFAAVLLWRAAHRAPRHRVNLLA